MRKILYILLLSLVLAAVDTENRRRAVVNVLPTTDSKIDAEDRIHIAGYYRYEKEAVRFWKFWRWGGWWD